MATTAHIGAAGELLVQYRLLRLGIDSARMTTDSGVDAVAYGASGAVTIQVKTQLQLSPSAGTGPLAAGFNFPATMPAQLLACVLLEPETVWLFTRAEAIGLAQQLSPNDVHRLYLFGPGIDASRYRAHDWTDLAPFVLEERAAVLFG